MDRSDGARPVIESKEIELKLELPPGCVATLRSLPALGDPERKPVRQETRYLDTPEGTLRKAGYSLRIRRKGRSWTQTVKHRGGDSGGFSSRAEWEQKIAGPELDFEALAGTPVGEILRRRKARKRLRLVSTTLVERTTWLLGRDDTTIELILDEGEVVSGEHREPVCEVELELKKGEPSALFALAREIAADVPVRMGVVSKSERGQRLLERKARRVHKAEPVRLERDMSIADAFAAIVQACLRHYRLNETVLLEGRNAPALHQARVAMRRLRSAFTLFGPVLQGEEAERLRAGLAALAELLGEARNLDVLLGNATPADMDHAQASASHKALRRSREDAYARVGESLRDPALPRLILDLVAWAEAGDWRARERARHTLPEFAAGRLDRGWRRVKRRAAELATLAPEQRHRLRIEIKKLRYAAEFFAALAPKAQQGAQKDFLEQLEAMQESLGRLNDFETARALAPELADAGGQAAETGRLIREAQDAWHRLRRAGPYWR